MSYDPEGKASRGECLRYDCDALAPSYVLYRCPRGHRGEILRCREHLEETVRAALSAEVFPVCVLCEQPVLMLPVLEGA